MSRLGRIGIAITLVLLFMVPLVFGIYHGAMPSIGDFFRAGVGIFVLYIPIGISEVLIYSPLLGSSSYITFITGNIMNLKVPIAKNAQDLMDTTAGTEESDVITTLATTVSAMVTIVMIAIGVILLVPLEPILNSPTVKGAADYVIPALFGALIVAVLRSTGEVQVKGKVKSGIVPFVLLLLVNILFINTTDYSGALLIVTIPITVGCAYFLYKKNHITIELKDDVEKTE